MIHSINQISYTNISHFNWYWNCTGISVLPVCIVLVLVLVQKCQYCSNVIESNAWTDLPRQMHRKKRSDKVSENKMDFRMVKIGIVLAFPDNRGGEEDENAPRFLALYDFYLL